MATKTIRVDYLARVEGEGALDLHFNGGRVASAQLRYFRAAALFRGILRGRGYAEVPDIVARICGICPVAYQMSAVHAIENAFGITVGRPATGAAAADLLRRMDREPRAACRDAACAGFSRLSQTRSQMARDHGDMVRNGLALKKAGNELMRVLGGREIHPVNVKPGGFYRVPSVAELAPVAENLKRARDQAIGLRPLGCELSRFRTSSATTSSLRCAIPDEYPFNEGRIVSNRGIDIDIADYETEFEERHVAHSTALHSVREAARRLSGRAARPLRPEFRSPAGIRPGACRARPGSARSAAIRSAASSCGPSRSSMRARKRCGLSRTMSRRTSPRCRSSRATARASAALRRHAASAGTATSSMPTARSARRASCRRPRRTSPASKPISSASRHRCWTSPTT